MNLNTVLCSDFFRSDSEDADIYEKKVHETEKRLIKMKQHQADLFAKVELKRKDIDKHQQEEKDKHNKQVNNNSSLVTK